MDIRLRVLLRQFVTFLLFFWVAKLGFMALNHVFWQPASAADVVAVLWHGLPLDLATSAYLTALPWLALALTAWWSGGWRLSLVWTVYNAVVSLLLAVIVVADACLYGFWEFKLDATVFNYLDSPQGATQSVSISYLLAAITAIVLSFAVLFWALQHRPRRLPAARRPWLVTGLFVLVGGLLFLMIRGGVGRSTANIGMAYFSSRQFLNHAAVNPAFSLVYSVRKTQDFSAEADFFTEKRRAALFAPLAKQPDVDVPRLLTTRRPNVIVILMEGFGGTFVEALGGAKGVTPCFNQLAREGIFFTQCYANSFRTDRGTVSTFSGYPSFPDVSVMKVPEKSRSLPSVAASLRAAGYTTDFLYGGDINFTNMKSYLMATGYERTYGDTDFPLSVRRTHAWGVTDSITFDRLYDMVMQKRGTQPWHIGFLTLASHEPWKVPYHRIPTDERANAMAYLDACLGRFVERLRHTPAWRNLLIVCLPDHGIPWPQGITENDAAKYHIPMLWIGGAVKAPLRVDKICNQSDMAATLLGQLDLPHKAFRFSRNVLSRAYAYPYAVHTWAGGFAFIDSTGYTVYDLGSRRVTADRPTPSALRLERGKAYLQTCYDDLGSH